MQKQQVKMTLNLTQDNYEIVKKISESTGLNKTDVINKAIVIEKFITEAQNKNQKILVQNEDGTIKEVIFR